MLWNLGLFAQGKPEWVEHRPVTSMYYIGIGFADKSDRNYMQAAKQNALHDLISEIKVKVSSSSLYHALEVNDNISSEFEKTILIEAQESIENFKLVDSWQDDRTYWVYYELNKFDYEEFVKKRRDQAIRMGFDCWQRGREAENHGDLALAANFFVKGLESIQPVANEELLRKVDGKQEDVGLLLYGSLRNLFSGVSIRLRNKYEDAVPFQGVKSPISVSVFRENVGCRNLPMTCEFVTGSGQLSSFGPTDQEGAASFVVQNVTSKLPTQEIRISVDAHLLASLKDGVYKGMYKTLVGELPSESLILKVAAQGTTAFVQTKQAADEGLKKVVMRLLTANYFSVVGTPGEADVLVLLDTKFRKGETVPGEMYNLTTYYSTVNLRFVDNRKNTEILNYGIDDFKTISSAKNSLATARNAAVREVSKRLNRELTKELKNLNISRDGEKNADPDVLYRATPDLEEEPEKQLEKQPEQKPVVPVKPIEKAPEQKPQFIEGELISNLFVRYVGRRNLGDKTLLEFRVINKTSDDYMLNLPYFKLKIVNEKGEELRALQMKLGSSEDSYRVNATIIPDVPTTLLVQVKKLQSVGLFQLSDENGVVKLRNIK